MEIKNVTTDDLEIGDMARPSGSGIEFAEILDVRTITDSRRRVVSDAGVRVCDYYAEWEVDPEL